MQVYSFSNCIAIVNGVEITGWAEGDDVIMHSRRVDGATDKIGADGNMMVSITSNRSGTIKYKLQQGSPSNKYLNDLLDLQSGEGTFIPIYLRFQDTFRQDMAQGTSGYIVKQPDMTRGSGLNDQEWSFVVEDLSLAFGAID